MDKKVACVIISCFALANAGLIPVPSAHYLEGPSSKTQVVGPDGSIIDAYAPGGKILLEGNGAGPLVQTAPVVLAQAAVAQPQVYSPLELQQVVLAEPASNSVEIAAPAPKIARVSENDARVFLHPGTAPRVETRESVPITEETEETVVPTTELPRTTESLESTSADLSGTYVPDNFERLFDDGSYRPEHY